MSEKTSEAESKRTVYLRWLLEINRRSRTTQRDLAYLIPISITLCYILKDSNPREHAYMIIPLAQRTGRTRVDANFEIPLG